MDGKEQIVFRTMQVRDIRCAGRGAQCFTVHGPGAFHTELTKNDNAHYIVAQLGEEIGLCRRLDHPR